MLRIRHCQAVNEVRSGDLEKNGYELLEAFATGDIDRDSVPGLQFSRSIEHILTDGLMLAGLDWLYNFGKFGCPLYHVAQCSDSADVRFRAEFEERKTIGCARYVSEKSPAGGQGVVGIREELNELADIKLIIANKSATSPTFAPAIRQSEIYILVDLQNREAELFD